MKSKWYNARRPVWTIVFLPSRIQAATLPAVAARVLGLRVR